MGFAVGETIGPYLLTEQLGQGGMATVFKAYHSALDRYVAIKALHPAFTIEPNFLARFRREAQVVARLEHPNIVPIYDSAEHEGRPYLVMKFIEGETLKARLSRGSLSHNEIEQVVESVGAALDYAHRQGILHRDVKPSNVLLASDGRIYLADFGLARIAEAGESTISSDVMLGTPQYVSPEQAMGRRDLDNGADIYSFGVLIYEMLVGKVPFSADTPYSIIHDQIYTPLPLPRSINQSIPEAVEQVLLTALAKARTDRFPDVATMVEVWKRAGQGVEVPVTVPSGIQIQSAAAIPAAEVSPPLVTAESHADLIRTEPDTARSESLPGLPVAEPEPDRVDRPKPRSRWRFVVILIIVLCLCVIASLVVFPRIRNRLLNPLGVAQLTPEPTSGAAPAAQITTTESAPPVLPATEIPSTVQASPEYLVEAARRKVTQSPQEPMAHFNLAVALWEAGLYEEADQEINLVIRFGGEDAEFYSRLGASLMVRKSWLLASRMYLQAYEYAAKPITDDLTERLHQCLYLAAQEDLFLDMLARSPLGRVNAQMLDVARARYALYFDDISQAERLINSLKKQGAALYELKLVDAEASYRGGDKSDAKAILENLAKDINAPRWVRLYADMYLKQITD